MHEQENDLKTCRRMGLRNIKVDLNPPPQCFQLMISTEGSSGVAQYFHFMRVRYQTMIWRNEHCATQEVHSEGTMD